jgi:hypothetical protein
MPAKPSVSSGHDVWCAQDWIAEPDVDAEGLTVRFSGHRARRLKTEAVVDHSVALNVRSILVGPYLEREEVIEIEARRFLETRENPVSRSGHPQVDVLRGSGAVETKLQDQPALQRHRGAQYLDDPCKKPVED